MIIIVPSNNIYHLLCTKRHAKRFLYPLPRLLLITITGHSVDGKTKASQGLLTSGHTPVTRANRSRFQRSLKAGETGRACPDQVLRGGGRGQVLPHFVILTTQGGTWEDHPTTRQLRKLRFGARSPRRKGRALPGPRDRAAEAPGLSRRQPLPHSPAEKPLLPLLFDFPARHNVTLTPPKRASP